MTKLTVNTAATAQQMAEAMFGPGVTITSATYTGDVQASGTYSDGNTWHRTPFRPTWASSSPPAK